jgi:hypothetical protein
MASSSPASSEVTDCPQCRTLCLGAILLPCGHLACRKCLRDAHGSTFTYVKCRQALPLPKGQGSKNFNDVIKKLGVDPVMSQLVCKKLKGQGRQTCVMCEVAEATMLCHDCKEKYCDDCTRRHTRIGALKDHVLQAIPRDQPTPNVSRPRHDSASSVDSALTSQSYQKTLTTVS